jgi:RNA polymerase sigma factor (sigma-70 family)
MIVPEKLREAAKSQIEGLIHKHMDLVYASALRQMRNPHAAADVTQAVFLILQRKLPLLGSHIPMSFWLLRATRYACLAARREARRRAYHESRVQAMHGKVPSATDENHDALEKIDEALGALGSTDRTVLELIYFEGQSHAEVGRRLRISEPTSRKRLQRALDRLRRILARRGAEVSGASMVGILAMVAKPAAAPASVGKAVMICLGGQAPAGVSIIAKGLSVIMKMAQVKLAAMVLAAATVGTGAVAAVVWAQADAPRMDRGAAPTNREIVTVTIPAEDALAVDSISKEEGERQLQEVRATLQTARKGWEVGMLTWTLTMDTLAPAKPGETYRTRGIHQMWWKGEQFATWLLAERKIEMPNGTSKIVAHVFRTCNDGALIKTEDVASSKFPRPRDGSDYVLDESYLQMIGGKPGDELERFLAGPPVPGAPRTLQYGRVRTGGRDWFVVMTTTDDVASMYVDLARGSMPTRMEWNREGRVAGRTQSRLARLGGANGPWFPVEFDVADFDPQTGKREMRQHLVVEEAISRLGDPAKVPEGVLKGTDNGADLMKPRLDKGEELSKEAMAILAEVREKMGQ